jgi:hypothetical protein
MHPAEIFSTAAPYYHVMVAIAVAKLDTGQSLQPFSRSDRLLDRLGALRVRYRRRSNRSTSLLREIVLARLSSLEDIP